MFYQPSSSIITIPTLPTIPPPPPSSPSPPPLAFPILTVDSSIFKPMELQPPPPPPTQLTLLRSPVNIQQSPTPLLLGASPSVTTLPPHLQPPLSSPLLPRPLQQPITLIPQLPPNPPPHHVCKTGCILAGLDDIRNDVEMQISLRFSHVSHELLVVLVTPQPPESIVKTYEQFKEFISFHEQAVTQHEEHLRWCLEQSSKLKTGGTKPFTATVCNLLELARPFNVDRVAMFEALVGAPLVSDFAKAIQHGKLNDESAIEKYLVLCVMLCDPSRVEYISLRAYSSFVAQLHEAVHRIRINADTIINARKAIVKSNSQPQGSLLSPGEIAIQALGRDLEVVDVLKCQASGCLAFFESHNKVVAAVRQAAKIIGPSIHKALQRLAPNRVMFTARALQKRQRSHLATTNTTSTTSPSPPHEDALVTPNFKKSRI